MHRYPPRWSRKRKERRENLPTQICFAVRLYERHVRHAERDYERASPPPHLADTQLWRCSLLAINETSDRMRNRRRVVPHQNGTNGMGRSCLIGWLPSEWNNCAHHQARIRLRTRLLQVSRLRRGWPSAQSLKTTGVSEVSRPRELFIGGIIFRIKPRDAHHQALGYAFMTFSL